MESQKIYRPADWLDMVEGRHHHNGEVSPPPERVALLAQRYEQGLDLFTGLPLPTRKRQPTSLASLKGADVPKKQEEPYNAQQAFEDFISKSA